MDSNLIEKLGQRNRRFNHYITLVPDARQTRKGLLGGMPVPVKDVIFTKGIRTTAASRVLASFVPSYSATVVRRIEDNGGVVVGKTNTHEFAMGPSTTSSRFGPAKNPNNSELITGGSSGGSAGTVGAGDVPAAIGTDTGGSVRMPAALCGVYGFKPTFGRISRFGIIPISWTTDCVGILARQVEDLIRVYKAVSGYDPNDPGTIVNLTLRDSKSKRIQSVGVIKEMSGTNEDTEVERAFERCLSEISSRYTCKTVSVRELAELERVRILILSAEAAAYHAAWFKENKTKYGKDVLQILMGGFRVKASDYVNAQRLRNNLTGKVIRLFSRYDLLVSPTVTIRPPRIRDVVGREREWVHPLTKNTSPFSMAGLPAISVPLANDIGVQLIANTGEDLALLNFARISGLGLT